MVNILYDLFFMCLYKLQEKESRLAYMRKQAREREGIAVELTSSAGMISTESGEGTDRHINLFSDIQQGVGRISIPSIIT